MQAQASPSAPYSPASLATTPSSTAKKARFTVPAGPGVIPVAAAPQDPTTRAQGTLNPLRAPYTVSTQYASLIPPGAEARTPIPGVTPQHFMQRNDMLLQVTQQLQSPPVARPPGAIPISSVPLQPYAAAFNPNPALAAALPGNSEIPLVPAAADTALASTGYAITANATMVDPSASLSAAAPTGSYQPKADAAILTKTIATAPPTACLPLPGLKLEVYLPTAQAWIDHMGPLSEDLARKWMLQVGR